jgi:hypothetical protein
METRTSPGKRRAQGHGNQLSGGDEGGECVSTRHTLPHGAQEIIVGHRQIDPETGAVIRTIESDRFVTGVTWVDGELWHGSWEDDKSDIRRINPESGAVLERMEMPRGAGVSGLESNGADLFYCGGGPSGKVRAVRRPKGVKP